MTMMAFQALVVLLTVVGQGSSFTPKTHFAAARKAAVVPHMGFFDNLFGGDGGGKAEASHILLKGDNAYNKCAQLRNDIYMTALEGADPNLGVDGQKLLAAFSDAAAKNSACPSAKEGGSLGSFGKGQMVPEFDAVVFAEPIGIVHGPVETQFGSHLILITDRAD